MKYFVVSISIFILLVISSTSSQGTSETDKTLEHAATISAGIQNFTIDFAKSFIKLKELVNEEERPEIISPIAVGYLLGVINTKIWPLPLSQLSKILHLRENEIQDSFRDIVDKIRKDPIVRQHSHIFTSDKEFQIAKVLEDLKTNVPYKNFISPNTNIAVKEMNLYLSEQTGNRSKGIVPYGTILTINLHDYTLGILSNTLTYKNKIPLHIRILEK